MAQHGQQGIGLQQPGDDNARMIREIMLVPLPLAASSRLINFFTFHISI